MANFLGVLEHVEEATVHQAETLCEQLLVNGFIPEAKILHEPIIGNTTSLDPIFVATVSFVLGLALNFADLLVHQKSFPRFHYYIQLSNKANPLEECIDLGYWTLFFGKQSK